MGRRSRPTDLIMKKILEFHGNGSVVEVEATSTKHQAGEAPSTKHQASSAKPPGGAGGNQKAPSTAKRTTNNSTATYCRALICLSLYTLRQPQPPAKYTTFYRISKHDKSSHPASIWPLTMVHGSYIMVDMFNFYWRSHA